MYCCIICDGWCGWLFLLPAFGLVARGVFTTNPADVWLPLGHSHPPVLPVDDWDITRLPPEVTCLLLSGPPSWFSAVFHLSWLSRFQVMWSCLLVDEVLPPPLPHYLSVSHVLIGGLLDASYHFWSSCPFRSPVAPTIPSRSLRHVMGVAVPRGIPVVAPPLVSPDPLNL